MWSWASSEAREGEEQWCSAFQELQPIWFGRAGRAQVIVRDLAARPRTLDL